MCVQKNGTAVRLSESSNFLMYIMISEIIAFNLYIHDFFFLYYSTCKDLVEEISGVSSLK